MSAIHYFQLGTADDLGALTAPRDLRSGTFIVHYIPDSPSDDYVGLVKYLASVKTAADHAAFHLIDVFPALIAARVSVDGVTKVTSGSITYLAGARLSFTFDSRAGSILVAGAATGNGTTTGTPWFLEDDEFRLGGNVIGTEGSDGHVSLLYAVAGANPASVKSLDFSQASNSAHFLTAGI